MDLTAVTALRAAHGIFRNDVLITPRMDEHGMHFSQVPFGSELRIENEHYYGKLLWLMMVNDGKYGKLLW